jgi:hypothetical protein
MKYDNLVLKTLLLWRHLGNCFDSKSEQLQYIKNMYPENKPDTISFLENWISGMKNELSKTAEQKEAEEREIARRLEEWELHDSMSYDADYTASCSMRDYGPSNPWGAPGMSTCDFI